MKILFIALVLLAVTTMSSYAEHWEVTPAGGGTIYISQSDGASVSIAD